MNKDKGLGCNSVVIIVINEEFDKLIENRKEIVNRINSGKKHLETVDVRLNFKEHKNSVEKYTLTFTSTFILILNFFIYYIL